ncbi:MAG: hypothetical protein AB1744_03885 [Candidatus Zixiibacteriota bacterium]
MQAHGQEKNDDAVVGAPKLDSAQQRVAGPQDITELKRAWGHFARAGFFNGESEEVLSLSVGLGVIVKKDFAISAGAGYENWRGSGKGVPIYVELQGYLWRGKVIPYWFLDGGILPFWPENTNTSDADYFLTWGAGVIVPLEKEYGVGGQLGYRTQSFVDGKIGLLSVMVGVHF